MLLQLKLPIQILLQPKIADDAVTLAKMAGLTRGSIIYGDSSGNPAALSLGSNGQVLTSDGTDISWVQTQYYLQKMYKI